MAVARVDFPGVLERPLYADDPVPLRSFDETDTWNSSADVLLRVGQPTLTLYRAAPGKTSIAPPAVLIFPGGGYASLYMETEGRAIAQLFVARGFAAAVVKYRLTAGAQAADAAWWPVEDAQRAIQVLRENAGSWAIDPQRVGLVGFSAGGHIAAMAGTGFTKSLVENRERTSLRPDFLVLLYPVISFANAPADSPLRKNLLGDYASAAQLRSFSCETGVTEATPPTWVAHAEDDTVVPAEQSRIFCEALKAHHVPTRLQIYPSGGHGFLKHEPRYRWVAPCIAWLAEQGYAAGSR